MSKELEAVKELYHEREYTYAESVNHKSKKWANDIKHYDNIGNCLIILEAALKRLETLEEEKQKKLKALEIIKKKIKFDFNDQYFGIESNYYIIVNNNIFGAIKVDKETHDLLKEVLL